MRLLSTGLLLWLACGGPIAVRAQLQLLPGREVQRVFAGEDRTVSLTWHNAGDQTIVARIRTRLYQTSSATAVLVFEKPWKTIEILPGQTVLDSVPLDFPAVNAKTRFLIQWLENSNRVVGVTQVRVYPTNLLVKLKPLAKNQSLGVFDPQNQLKPLLKKAGVDFVDLGNTEMEHFPGKLAIIGPFASKTQVPHGLTKQIKILARKGVAVVWIIPPHAGEELQPSFYLVPKGLGVVVVAQANMVSNLVTNPDSQLNLLYFCGLAIHPKFLTLPEVGS